MTNYRVGDIVHLKPMIIADVAGTREFPVAVDLGEDRVWLCAADIESVERPEPTEEGTTLNLTTPTGQALTAMRLRTGVSGRNWVTSVGSTVTWVELQELM